MYILVYNRILNVYWDRYGAHRPAAVGQTSQWRDGGTDYDENCRP